jgi:alpha-L-fucosidase
MKIRYLSTPLLLALALSVHAATPANSPVLAERGETAAEHDARMAWFRDARFGLFVHWGLYAQAGGMWEGKPAGGPYGEWIMCHAKIKMADYATLAKDFNPKNYDAEKWVLAAKEAGMKYLVITAKHHEGFAMFPSKASPYNIKDATPFDRDPLKELAAACRKHGMKLGFYYSQNLDWHHPGGGSGDWDPAHKGDSDQYVDNIVIPQLREILTNYGKIDILWFDIPGGAINKPRADRVMKAVLECNPDILINNRLGGGYRGDTETPEQHIPPTGFPGRDWEVCMTMNNTWGFKKHDHAWKAPKQMVRMLCDISSKGGNYLLNVGPNELGEIPEPSLERLKEVGTWTKANGEALYGTMASPFPSILPWGRVTTRGNKLYLMVFDAPKDGLLALPGLETPLKSVSFLAEKSQTAPTVKRDAEGGQAVIWPEGVSVGNMPVVLVAELAGAPKVSAKTHLIAANPAGAFALTANNAAIKGALQLENVPGTSQVKDPDVQRAVTHWIDAADSITWRCKVASPGTYAVKLEYACQDEDAGSTYAITANGSLSADGRDLGIKGKVEPTGNWNTYRWSEPMSLEIPKAGEVEIELKATHKLRKAVMNVRRMVLEKK